MKEVTFNGFHLPTLARLAHHLGCPIDDSFAEFIWRLSNYDSLPGTVAAEFMKEAGYSPFRGFPLVRLTRAA